MATEQMIVIYEYSALFQERVNLYSKHGWRIVPGTTHFAVFPKLAGESYPREKYSVVMEREVQP